MIVVFVVLIFGVVIVGVLVGVFMVIFIVEVVFKWVVDVICFVVELFAGIFFVVYGFFGLVIIVLLI